LEGKYVALIVHDEVEDAVTGMKFFNAGLVPELRFFFIALTFHFWTLQDFMLVGF